MGRSQRVTCMQSDFFSLVFDEFERLYTTSAQCLNSYWYKVIQWRIKCAVLGDFCALCLGCHRTWGNYSNCSVRIGKCIWTGKVPDNTFATFPWNNSDTIRSLAICMSKASWFKVSRNCRCCKCLVDLRLVTQHYLVYSVSVYSASCNIMSMSGINSLFWL